LDKARAFGRSPLFVYSRADRTPCFSNRFMVG
jgi:hypothetical protein